MNLKSLSSLLILSVLLFASCFDNGSDVGEKPSAEKAITSFSIEDPAATGVIDGSANTIAVTVPFGTDVTALVPVIEYTGADIDPASGTAQDFTNPVTYTVTAADGSTKEYTVTVSVALNSAKDITSFTILGANAAINGNGISITLPYGTDKSSLTPVSRHHRRERKPLVGHSAEFY